MGTTPSKQVISNEETLQKQGNDSYSSICEQLDMEKLANNNANELISTVKERAEQLMQEAAKLDVTAKPNFNEINNFNEIDNFNEIIIVGMQELLNCSDEQVITYAKARLYIVAHMMETIAAQFAAQYLYFSDTMLALLTTQKEILKIFLNVEVNKTSKDSALTLANELEESKWNLLAQSTKMQLCVAFWDQKSALLCEYIEHPNKFNLDKAREDFSLKPPLLVDLQNH